MKNQRLLIKTINYIDKIIAYTKDVDYQGFKENTMMVEACVFNLSQIGELVNKLEKGYIIDNPEIPWFKIKGLRNRIIHDYEGVNHILIWEIITTDLKKLKTQLDELNKK